MKSLQHQFITTVKIVVLALILATGLHYVSAATSWSPAGGPPPGNNTYAPINVGAAGQTKSGGITVGTGNPTVGFQVSGGAVRFTSPTLGTPSSGYVLKSDGTGNVTWQPDATGGGGGGGINCVGCSGNDNRLTKVYQNGSGVAPSNIYSTGSGNSGSVGINTANPAFTLDVAGQVNATAYCINGVCSGGGGTVSYSSSPAGATASSNNSSVTNPLPQDWSNFWVRCPTNHVMTGLQLGEPDTGNHRRYRVVSVECAPLKTP